MKLENIKHISIVVGILLALPSLATFASHIIRGEIATAEQATIPWRWSKLFTRVSTVSPVFWNTADEANHEADIALNKRYLSEVISGADGSATVDDHLDFLSSRPQTDYWQSATAQLHFHYGEFEKLNSAPLKAETLRQQLASALILNDEERLEAIQSLSPTLPSGIAYKLNIEPEDTKEDQIFSIFKAQSAEDILSKLESMPLEWHALAIEAALEHPDADIEQIQTLLMDVAPTTPAKSCALIALAQLNTDPILADEAIDLVLANPQYPTRLTISQYGICNPLRFEPWPELSINQQRHLLLFQAQSWLAKYEIAKAQTAIKKAETLTLIDEEDPLQIKILHLRVLARELAGDLSGAEKYAKKGVALDKAIFTHHLGRIAMLRNQKTEGLRLLSSIGYYPLPEPLSIEFSELLAIARRLNGSPAKLNIQNEEIGHTLFDDDEQFRVWLIDHIDTITLPPKPSIALPMLNAWRGVDRHGEFMLKTQRSTLISPESIAIRAQLRLLQAAIEGDDAAVSAGWKSLVKARRWLSEVPHPELLKIMPDAFVLEVQ